MLQCNCKTEYVRFIFHLIDDTLLLGAFTKHFAVQAQSRDLEVAPTQEKRRNKLRDYRRVFS